MYKRRALLSVIAAALVLTGCSGGGSGAGESADSDGTLLSAQEICDTGKQLETALVREMTRLADVGEGIPSESYAKAASNLKSAASDFNLLASQSTDSELAFNMRAYAGALESAASLYDSGQGSLEWMIAESPTRTC